MTVGPFALLALALLVAVALAAGAVIGLGGPGGAPFVAGLLVIAGFTPGAAAGTAAVALAAVLLAGTAVYARSGDVRWRVAAALAVPTLVGTQVGAAANAAVSPGAFDLLFGGVLALVGAVVLYRELSDLDALHVFDSASPRSLALLAGLGLFVGTLGGLSGLGGPTLAVPGLLLLDVPLLEAVGTAQVEGVVATGATGLTYLSHGTVALGAVGALAPPLVVGLAVGWFLAHHVDERLVALAIGALLLAVAPYFLL